MRKSVAGVLLIAALNTACDMPGAPQQYTVRDSVGVSIAESAAPAWGEGEGWTLADTPHLRIGETDAPGHDLYDVRGVVRLRDGRVAVANSGSSEIRIFSTDGALLETIGGPGEGPGEFRNLWRIFLLPGDSLLVTDASLDRLTVFSPDGELVRTARFEASPSGGVPTPSTRLGDGSFIALPSFTFGSGSGSESRVVQDTVALMRYRMDGSYAGEIGRSAGSEHFMFVHESGMLGGPRIWGRRTHIAAAGDQVIVGHSADHSYEVWNADGRVLRKVRAERPLRPVTDADVALMREPDPESDPGSTDMFNRVLDALPPPTHFPAYEDIEAESDGHVWIRDYVWPDEGAAQEWQVFDPEGRWLGAVTMPPGFTPLVIEADEILGIFRDDMDVEHLHGYRLSRGAP
ncbi:MAG TPA: 6-bladed beta-propeller [Longimicrobiales bacterium]|nr:6-bladed beta-propeller [Longimicrobiales bacterium]